MRLEGKCFPSYAELQSKVQSLYPNVPDTASMIYRDAEGDIVTIVDDDSVRAVVIDAASKRSPNIRIALRVPEAPSTEAASARVGGAGCRKQQRGCPLGHGGRRGKCSPGGWCMSALSPFSMRSVGVALGLRIIFGMSWCSIFGLAILRHFYLKSSWRSGCHGGRMWTASYPPWWHIQGPPNFQMHTPFFSVIAGNDYPTTRKGQCHNGVRQCGHWRQGVARQHATEGPAAATNLKTTTDQREPDTDGATTSVQQEEDTVTPSTVASTAAAALIDEVVQSVAPYIMHVEAETDAVMVDNNIGVQAAADTEGTDSISEDTSSAEVTGNADDEVAQKVELIKSMGFNLSDETIAAFVKEMNGRVDLIVSALLKNNSRA